MAHGIRQIFTSSAGPKPPALPKSARHHSYARTKDYLIRKVFDKKVFDKEDGTYYEKFGYYEARENPLTRKWRVSKRNVLQAPDKNGQPHIEPPVHIAFEFSFTQALEFLDQVEKDNMKLPDQAEPPRHHYKQVAIDEQIALDIDGKAHPTLNGRIVTQGVFPAGLKEKLKKAYKEPVFSGEQKPVCFAENFFIWEPGKFNKGQSIAVTREPFSALDEGLEDLEIAIRKLIAMQAENYAMVFKDKTYGPARRVIEVTEIQHEDAFFKHLKRARAKLQANPLLTSEQQEIMCDAARKIELAHYIGYAKYCHIKHKSSETSEKTKKTGKDLEKATKQAVEFWRDKDGSDEELCAIQAEIIADDSKGSILVNRLIHNSSDDIEPDSHLYKALKKTTGIFHFVIDDKSLFFIPAGAGDFITDLEGIKKEAINSFENKARQKSKYRLFKEEYENRRPEGGLKNKFHKDKCYELFDEKLEGLANQYNTELKNITKELKSVIKNSYPPLGRTKPTPK